MEKLRITNTELSLIVGWQSKVQYNKGTFFVSVNKNIARGLGLSKGDILKSYLAKDSDDKLVIVSVLEKENKNA
jgi:hypothetical protein